MRTLINACLDVIDVSRWTGDATNANFIAGQLRLLSENVHEAKQHLRGAPEVQTRWNEELVDPSIFDPPLPPNLNLHFTLYEAALVLQVRTLEPSKDQSPESFTGLGLRDRLASALGGTRTPTHDEGNEVFLYRGQEVKVKEKIRVESQDPSLMAAMAKLSALDHTVALARRALEVVMGREH